MPTGYKKSRPYGAGSAFFVPVFFYSTSKSFSAGRATFTADDVVFHLWMRALILIRSYDRTSGPLVLDVLSSLG